MDEWLSTAKSYLECASGFMSTFLWFFIVLLLFPFGAAPIFLTALGIYSGWATPEAAMQWTHDALPWMVSAAAFGAGLIVSVRDRKAFLDITTPRISMELEGVQQDIGEHGDDDVQEAILLFRGLCAIPQRVELFCLDVQPIRNGSTTISIIVNQPGISFTVSRGELHRVAAIRYDWKEPLADINVLVPCKRVTDDVNRGSEFLVTFAAYGAMQPVELRLVCSLGDNLSVIVADPISS